jgi:Saxitoxin biosynthesis operon protein SxtJ
VKIASENRSFGLIMGIVCAIIGLLAYRAGRASDVIWMILAAIFLPAALLVPRVLAPARRGWLKLGSLLGKVINAVVLGVVYSAVFIPISGLMRLLGRDAMARRWNPAAKSYWISRTPGPPTAESLKEQF